MSFVKTFSPATNYFSDFDNLVDQIFKETQPISKVFRNAAPLTNIHETEKEYSIEMAAPGYEKESFKISLEEKQLKISAEITQETEHKKTTLHEFLRKSFERSFYLPDAVDTEKITANYVHGILTVSIPKPEVQEKKTKEIQVL